MSWQAKNLDLKTHNFFGRKGGVSSDKYESLNVNTYSDDAVENIDKNFEIIANHFNLSKDSFYLLNQSSHSNKAVFVNKPEIKAHTADGLVTKTKGLILGITTADCIPVLFADHENNIICAAHAGWKGAVRGIIENTINLMIEKGAQLKNIRAALGPCMQKQSFECQQNMADEFIKLDKSYIKYFEKKNDTHYTFDSEKFVIDKIKNAGINNIEASNIDTYSNEDEYFSYRRFCHQEKLTKHTSNFPNQLSCIVLKD